MPGIGAFVAAGALKGIGDGITAEAKQWLDEKKAALEMATQDRRRAEDRQWQEERDRRQNEFQTARDEIANTNAESRIRLQDELSGARDQQKFDREAATKGSYATGADGETFILSGDKGRVVTDADGNPIKGLNRSKDGENGLNANQRRNALNDGIKAGAPDITKGQSGQDWEKTFRFWKYNGLDPNDQNLRGMVEKDLRQQAKDQKLAGADADRFVQSQMQELYGSRPEVKGGKAPADDGGVSFAPKGEQPRSQGDPNAPLLKRDRDGMLSEHASNTPPVQGAKRAADGIWYVPDPNRPGKWLKVN